MPTRRAHGRAGRVQPVSDEEGARIRPRVPAEHASLNARAKAYARRTHEWLQATAPAPDQDCEDPRHVIAWFHVLIAVKINRSLTVWPDEDPRDPVAVSDNDGSAKVALLGIDRSHAAWLALVERGALSPSHVPPFVADLVWLGEALERVRPNARAFVRPAFDEPDAIRSLLAEGEAP